MNQTELEGDNPEMHEPEEVDPIPQEETDIELFSSESSDEAPKPPGMSVDDAQKVIAQLQEGNRNLYDQLLRSRADFENYKRRLEREKENQIAMAKSQFLRQFLNIVDNFDRALTAVNDPQDPLAVGLAMVYKQLQEFFKDQGMEEIPAENQPFDPYLHEALAQMESTEVPDNTVLEVFRKGYKLDGKLLRASQVKVSVYPQSPEPPGSDSAPQGR